MNDSRTWTSQYRIFLFFLIKVQMVQAKMNLYLSLPIYSLIST